MFDGMEYSSSTAECFSNLNSMPKKKKNKNKRRFSDEQIRSLEVMFESETKLEPKKKLELAKELGLQPRQVAIWFQNKRARWKSKHIEKEYSVLLAKYNNLASQFESLKKEKQSLAVQLQKLKNEKTAGKCDDEKGNHSEIKLERAVNNSSSSTEGETIISDHNTKIDLAYCRCLLSDDDSCSMRAGLLELDEENELLKMVDPSADHSSVEDWGSLDSDDLINQPTGSTFQWWDFWSS